MKKEFTKFDTLVYWTGATASVFALAICSLLLGPLYPSGFFFVLIAIGLINVFSYIDYRREIKNERVL